MSNNSTSSLIISKPIHRDPERVIERRMRELYDELHAQQQIVGVLRSELIKALARIERLEAGASE